MSTSKLGCVSAVISARVIDGDSYELLLDLGWGVQYKTTVRLDGYNTPEIRGADEREKELGRLARHKVKDWFREHTPIFVRWVDQYDAYGRALVNIYSHNADLGVDLMAWGLAAYDDGGDASERKAAMAKLVENWYQPK